MGSIRRGTIGGAGSPRKLRNSLRRGTEVKLEDPVVSASEAAVFGVVVVIVVSNQSARTDPIYFYGYAKEWGEFTSFFVSQFEIGRKYYSTVEHYFQSMKFQGRPEEKTVRDAATGEEAQRMGRMYPLRPDWEAVKHEVMRIGQHAKFTQHDGLRSVLLGTANRQIIFDDPKDCNWGGAPKPDGSPGENLYGKMLMDLRAELRLIYDPDDSWKRLGHACVLEAIAPVIGKPETWEEMKTLFKGNKAAAVRAEASKIVRGHVDRQALILDESNLLALEKGFQEMDADDSGSLSIFELQRLWSAVFVELPDEEVQRITEHIWPDIDVDDDDEITFEELVSYLKGVASKSENEIDQMLGVEERKDKPHSSTEWVWAVVDQGAGDRYALKWLRRLSMVWAMSMQLSILLSILIMICESLPELTHDDGTHGNAETRMIETCCIMVFSVEFGLRFLSCPSQRDLWTSFFTYVDLLAILPFYLTLLGFMGENSSADSLSVLRALRFVRLVRVLRVIKLGRNAEGIQLMTVAMSRSKLALTWAMVLIIMAVVLFSSLMFYCEKEDAEFVTNYTHIPGGTKVRAWVRKKTSALPDAGLRTHFQSIPDAMWWALVTLTTTGFGDQLTRTDLGKAVASVTMGTGLLVLAYPVTVISTNFAEVQQEFDERRKKQRRREHFQHRLAEQKKKEMDKTRRKESRAMQAHARTAGLPEPPPSSTSMSPSAPLQRRESILNLHTRGSGHGSTLGRRQRGLSAGPREAPRVSSPQGQSSDGEASCAAPESPTSSAPCGTPSDRPVESGGEGGRDIGVGRPPLRPGRASSGHGITSNSSLPRPRTTPTHRDREKSFGNSPPATRRESFCTFPDEPHPGVRLVPVDAIDKQLVHLQGVVTGLTEQLTSMLPLLEQALDWQPPCLTEPAILLSGNESSGVDMERSPSRPYAAVPQPFHSPDPYAYASPNVSNIAGPPASPPAPVRRIPPGTRLDPTRRVVPAAPQAASPPNPLSAHAQHWAPPDHHHPVHIAAVATPAASLGPRTVSPAFQQPPSAVASSRKKRKRKAPPEV
eukprot:Hpha_TRINITY_DN16130_c0_g2::TRINITY_DN16130_c0_g2_i5::g.5758::m.5758